ncbi:MAG: tetratricopeptide repeat protein [Bdellovibrionaceae bacterium]|nr:tetratricopeptide repeat protein [Pseudobdellovibrionaceae bacterium]
MGAVIVLTPALTWAQPQVRADMSRVGDASHLELDGQTNWKYDLRREEDRVILRIPPLSSESLIQLRTHSDALIQRVEVDEQGVDGSHEVTFHLKNKAADFFDYLTEDPPKLIVDFFPKEEKSKVATSNADSRASEKSTAVSAAPNAAGASTSSADKAAVPNELPAKSATVASKKGQDPVSNGKSSGSARKPAATEFMQAPAEAKPGSSTGEQIDFGGDGVGSGVDFQHGIFDGGDPTFKRFAMPDYEIKESAIIASRGNIYLRFPPLKLDSPHLATLLQNPPIYEIIPNESRENKEAQLLLTLFNNKRHAVFLKTAKEYLERYPHTMYDEIIRYMMADTHYDLWRKDRTPVDFEKAMGMYRHLAEKYPESPLATRTLLLIGYSYLDRGNNFDALKALQKFLRVRVGTKFTDQVKISIAEAYLNLNRYDDALHLLGEIETTAKAKKDAVEAAYRVGDVHFQRKDFPATVRVYKEAVQKYPDHASRFPNAFYNVAEAQFWQGQYRESLDSYRQYLERFPQHDHGGYAMTRIGELLEIMGAEDKRALGAYLESFFRYRETPGANLARVRTLISRFPDMKVKELKNSLAEIERLTNQTPLPDIKEFVTVLAADGHYRRKDFKRSTDELVAFYQQNPAASNREKFQSRIVRNITEAMRESVQKGDFIEALRVNSQYSQTWLKNSDRIDTRFYVGRAFEQAGVYKESENVYRETLNKLYAIRGTPREKERSVFEILPETDSLNLRLAVVAGRERDYARAAEHLKAINPSPRLTEAELIERAEVSADVAEARGQIESAKGLLAELVSTWKGQPAAVSDLYLRLAKLNAQTKNFREAEAAVTKIIHLQNDTSLVSDDTHAKALELKGDMLLSRGQRAESVAAFRELLEVYDGKRPLGAVRYKAGKILFENGEIKAAEDMWANLKDDKNDLWHKLAKEQLESAKWKGDYKKYIERIPAMQDMKRE